MINFKGSAINILFTVAEKHPHLTIGQILHSALGKKNLKKHFVEATDEEIYTALEKFTKHVEEDDSPYTNEEFMNWLNSKTY